MHGNRRLHVETIRTDELGDRSYVIHDGHSALVVDPQRDIDRINSVVADRGLVVCAVAETHIHNDYLSGGLALAQSAGVPYLVAAAEEVSFDRTAVADGSVFHVGSLEVQVVATPGHTPNHLSFVVTDSNLATALFSGGSMLYGSVGRTDLVDPRLTPELTLAQYRSVRRLAESVPGEALLFPTHGFGSFCSAGAPTAPRDEAGTVAAEREANPALLESDERQFVAHTISGYSPYPSYYVHMAPRNRAGVGPADLSLPPRAGADELSERIGAGEWVADLRGRRSFAADHLRGTVSVELGPQFATYLGWVFPYSGPLTLIAESVDQIAAAQRQLVRIGIDRPAAAAFGNLADIAPALPRGSYQVVSFAEVFDAQPPSANIIDVRRPDEIRRDGAIPRSTQIPLADLPDRLSSLPDGLLWVHCASGFRAAIAASLLERVGRSVALIDEPFTAALAVVSAT